MNNEEIKALVLSLLLIIVVSTGFTIIKEAIFGLPIY